MSVGCNTLLLPGGCDPTRSHSRPLPRRTPQVRPVGSTVPDAPRLIPPLAASVIPCCCPTPQIRDAAATACLIRAEPATDEPPGGAALRGLTLIWARRISSP